MHLLCLTTGYLYKLLREPSLTEYSSFFSIKNMLSNSSLPQFPRNALLLRLHSFHARFLPIFFDRKPDTLCFNPLECWELIIGLFFWILKSLLFLLGSPIIIFLPTILLEKASAVLKCPAKCHKIICEFLVNVLENKRAIRSKEC